MWHGTEVIRTPYQAPNANAHAERFVRSIKEESLERMILLGEHHFRRSVREYVSHYHGERNQQGLDNQFIESLRKDRLTKDPVQRRERLGGMLSFYYREAA